MDENFPPQPGRRVAFAWQFPPSAWDSDTTHAEERPFNNRASHFPFSTWSADPRAELNNELAYNVAHRLDPDLAPLYRAPVTPSWPDVTGGIERLAPLGATGPDEQAQSHPSWTAEPFSWLDRYSAHQADRHGTNPETASYPGGYLAWRERNSTYEANHDSRVPTAWDTESVHSWRDADERPPSPNWNAEPPSWVRRDSIAQANQIQDVQGSRNDGTTGPLSFLDMHVRGDATITFPNDHKEMESIQGLNLDIIRLRCAVLAMAFEPSRTGPRLFLEVLTSTTALPFLRFLYTGSYSSTGADDEDVPTSVLFHFQMYRLGDIYDLEDLKTQARVNVFRQCEYGCCSPDKPIDLCAAIRWFYTHLAKHDGSRSTKHDALVNTVIDYCVTCFLRHRLGENMEFRELAYELRPFHQALCSNIRDRNFDPNETATAIIQLPFRTYAPETYASREDASAQRFDDVVFHFHAQDELDIACKKRKRVGQAANQEGKSLEMALRPHPRAVFSDTAQFTPKPVCDDISRGIISKRRASTAEDSNIPSPVDVAPGRVATLPLRPSQQPSESDASATDPQAAMRRRITIAQQAQLSLFLSGARAASTEKAAGPDEDFEAVSPPPRVEALSDSDSEGSFVQVTREDVKAEGARSRSRASNAARTSSGSDSEWELM